ncbi:hypothetical protein [Pantoea ananatis]|jgi:hypothetical protein|uniref:hypothetical protein n=1 Tax=Pantoea ananas TaxID=553 RepID=UPI000CF56178|nr:hypothetical protein [Pantoea ananatis]MDQ1223874.1 hypothetical protein [Pantoea ananatis]MDR6092598.1 hypothetical protein [Pantoea ananatis]NQE77648.1 hypothetical protein [Pantoea ananatis]NQE82192.1 hypothetical protein [Pantoea ananatis]PQK83049.1 hypothetical protein CG432_22660 [Pantoea ananatis]
MKKTSALEEKFKQFILKNEGGISIDDIQDKFRTSDGHTKKMADFLLNENKFILEMKSIFSDRTINVNDKLNEIAKSDTWLAKNWFGSVHLEELIQKHPNSADFRHKIMNFAYDGIRNKIIKEAHKQIGTTKDVLKLANSIGGLILLNDKVPSYKSDYLSEEIRHLLETKKYSNIEFVVYISQLTENSVEFIILLDSESANKEFIEWYMNNILLLNWASFNKYAIKINETSLAPQKKCDEF